MAVALQKRPIRSRIVYGPVRSRRLGFSLGVNLMPSRYKLCSFNCLCCPYSWTCRATAPPGDRLKDTPPPDKVLGALENALQRLSHNRRRADSIVICGNGEPTLHPHLREIVEAVKELRDRYLPRAATAIFSNSSTVADPRVRDTLDLLDLNVMKFDAGSEELIRELNQPAGPIYVGELVAGLRELKRVHLASLFVQGRVTNADPDSVELWSERIEEIRPALVQIYTLDRPPVDPRIEKVSLPTLQWIAEEVHWRTRIPVEIC
ncbi:MAG TPA: radical SAM protein [candidate division Zixibacteria bacterium]|nr:radical SAM protein [candidate division Zixibacteria bacterium]